MPGEGRPVGKVANWPLRYLVGKGLAVCHAGGQVANSPGITGTPDAAPWRLTPRQPTPPDEPGTGPQLDPVSPDCDNQPRTDHRWRRAERPVHFARLPPAGAFAGTGPAPSASGRARE